MNNAHNDLSSLRDLIYSGSSPTCWDELCARMDAWPNDTLDVALDYAEAHLAASWPDEARIARRSWWYDLQNNRHQPRWRLVRNLKIAALGSGDDAASLLAHSERLRSVTHLDLAHNNLTTSAARALASSPNTGNLQHLDLGANPIGDQGLIALSSSPNLPSLRHLDLTNTAITSKGLHALTRSPIFAQLHHLSLWGNALKDADFEAFGRAPLQSLDLGRTKISDRALEALCNAHFPHLHTLNLSSNSITNAGLSSLSLSNAFPSMRKLKLFDNPFDDDGRQHLRSSETLSPSSWWG